MAYNLRIYGHQGLQAMYVANTAGQDHKDSVYHLTQPYLWTQLISVSNVAASSTAITPPVSGYSNDPTSILHIEVPDGQTIRYEINPPNRSAVAGNGSPSLSGKNQFAFGPSYTISVIDAAGLP